MQSSERQYGWIPDLADQRDVMRVTPDEILRALPAAVDMRALCPPVYDQGKLGSCTANAIAAAIAFEQRKLDAPERFTPSRLFIYYNERALQGTISADTGAPLREGMKAVNHAGVCPEDQPEDTANWPYDPAQFASTPPGACYAAARHVRALRYRRVQHNAEALKGCLAEGSPFVFGITVYESFESPQVKQSGIVALPQRHERVIGGHAMMAVGYDDARQALIVRNSWGPQWGDQGYGYLPYEYLFGRSLARDFWTIELISDTAPVAPPASAQATPANTTPNATPASGSASASDSASAEQQSEHAR